MKTNLDFQGGLDNRNGFPKNRLIEGFGCLCVLMKVCCMEAGATV